MVKESGKRELYRECVLRGALRLEDPREVYDEYEFFYEWLDDTYSPEHIEELKRLKCFSSKEFGQLDKIDNIMNSRYEEYKKTKTFTEAMWQEIHDAQQAFLNLPSIKKDIAKL